MARKIRARLAWAASFLKRRWDFDDYPIEYVDQGECDRPLPERLRSLRWRADVINWPGVSGIGDSKEEALADAQRKFAERETSGEKKWRPGTGPAITLASTEKVDRHPELRGDFIRNILGHEWAWISDESSLWEFHEEADNSGMFLKIGEVYGVDVSDIETANLSAILDRIMEEIEDFPEDPTVRAIRLSRAASRRHIMCLPELPWNPYAPT